MKLVLIAIFVLLMAQGTTTADNCERWMDIILYTEGNGVEGEIVLHANTAECGIPSVDGNLTTKIYERTTGKLLFSRKEATNYDNVDLVEGGFVYYFDYISFDELDLSSVGDKKIYFVTIEMTFKSDYKGETLTAEKAWEIEPGFNFNPNKKLVNAS